MTMQTIHDNHPSFFTSRDQGQGSFGFLSSVGKAVKRYFRARHAIAHLRSLDDDLLADIGIARRDIESAVRQDGNHFDTGGRV